MGGGAKAYSFRMWLSCKLQTSSNMYPKYAMKHAKVWGKHCTSKTMNLCTRNCILIQSEFLVLPSLTPHSGIAHGLKSII